MRYYTLHKQKDGRWTTVTAVHKYKDCKQLKSRTGIVADSDTSLISSLLPKCYNCYNRQEKSKL